MPRNIDTALLRAFVAVADAGGMTAAADRLALTQAAVSQQIRRLEDAFGRRLFERDHRRIRLSPAGERLLPRARRLLALNDELWSLMTGADHEGEVRLGVPHDIVGPFLPPVLRSFDQAWPRVRVTIASSTTPQLLSALARRAIDLTLTTEPLGEGEGETLMPDSLVWVGAPGGRAHTRDPLPVSLGGESCAFRKVTLDALAGVGRDWREVCNAVEMPSLLATVEADLAVAALLVSTVPENLGVIGPGHGLPSLPAFAIKLHLPTSGSTPIANELARHIRDAFAARYLPAAMVAS
jgi:DNA-binding transcriptional LysR family regulator